MIIKIAKASIQWSEIPEFQPEQVERVLQIRSREMGRFGNSLVLPRRIVVVLPICRAQVALLETAAAF